MHNAHEVTIIENLLLVPVEERHGMVQRSLELNVNQRDLNILSEMYHQSQTGKLSAMDIATHTPNALRLSDMASKEVQIENGWGTKRFRFMMTVATKKSNGSVYRSYVQGYTDYADMSISGIIDPDIELIFNSMINTVTVNNPVSGEPETRVSSTFSILFDRAMQKYDYHEDHNTLRLLRPLDVVNNMEVMNTYGDGVETINVTARHVMTPTTSTMNNRTGAEHMSKVLNSMSKGSITSSIGHSGDDVFTNAKGMVTETNLASIPIVDIISDLRHSATAATVTIRELDIISPNIGEVTFVSEPRQSAINMNPHANILLSEDTESLRNTTKEATIAAMIADMSTGMLIENMLTTVTFSMTNMTPDSSIVDTVMDFNSIIQGMNKQALVDRFITKFITIVMPQITENGLLGVEIMASLDVMGDAKVSVMIAGSHPEIYTVPIYADSLFTSVVSDAGTQNRSMHEYGELITAVTN